MSSEKVREGFPIRSLFKIFRPSNLLILAFTQFFTAIFLVGPYTNFELFFQDTSLYLLVVSTIFIAAAGYVINDYYDVKIDIINKPERLVIGRTISRRQAMVIHFFLNGIGIMCALLISIKIAVIHTFAAFLLWWYSNYLKRLPLIGNMAVSALTGMAVLVVGLLYKKNMPVIIVYAVFAFFISLIREIIKDMEDVKGDSNFGCLTLPIKYGIRSTKRIIFVIEAVFLFLLFLIGLLNGMDLLIFYVILVIIPLLILSFYLFSADTRKDFSYLSKLCKIIMICGVISMVFM